VPWNPVRGHDRIVSQLVQSFAGGRFPHALLFVGPSGIGKRLLARKLAQALVCERRGEHELEACEDCDGCLQAAAGTHPDLMEVARPEDKQDLPIRVIRDLCASFGLKPSRGLRKVAIIDDADDINDEAANALLKTLEEPPPGALLILIGTSAELQLETIISRCQVMRFDPLGENDLAEILLGQGVAIEPAEARRLAVLGEGSVSRAIEFAEGGFQEFRRTLIDENSASHGFNASELASKIQAYLKQDTKDSNDQRRRAVLVVGEVARFLRGLLWQTSGLEPPSTDSSDRIAVEQLANRVEPEDVFLSIERCLLADQQIQRNLYMPLVLESFTHDLAKHLNPRFVRA